MTANTMVSVGLQAAETALLIVIALGVGLILMLFVNDQLTRYFARRDIAEGMPTVQYRVRFRDADGTEAHFFDDLAGAGDFFADKRAVQSRDGSVNSLSIDRRKVGSWEPMHIDDRLLI